MTEANISVLIERDGRTYRVIDNLRTLLTGQSDRSISNAIVGKKVLDLANEIRRGTE